MTHTRVSHPARSDHLPCKAVDLQLSGLVPVAHGAETAVYTHPDHPDLVFKIVVGKNVARFPTKLEHVALRLFPETLKMRRTQKEFQSHAAAKLRYYRGDVVFPAAEMRGFYETDIGLALAFEKIRGEDGELATSLQSLLNTQGFGEEHVGLLNAFAARLLAWNPVATDLNLDNIVLGVRHGEKQFVLIDGMGAPHLVPLWYMSRTFNRTELVRRLETIGKQVSGTAGRIQLRFDRKARKFEISGNDHSRRARMRGSRLLA